MKTQFAEHSFVRPFAQHVVLLLLAFTTASAWAQGGAAPSPPASPASAPATVPPPAARWTVEQIRQAFDNADADSNGVLSRAEAQRLALLPLSFEDMDQNKDGVLVRAEYERAFAR